VYAGYEKTKHSISFYVFNEGVIPEYLKTDMFQKECVNEKEKDFDTYGMKLLGEQFLNGTVGYKSIEETGTRFYITLRL
jgi:hypothetical protein